MIFPFVLSPPPGRNVKLNFTLGWEGANLTSCWNRRMLKVPLTSQTFMLNEACFKRVSVWEVFCISLGKNSINHMNANGAGTCFLTVGKTSKCSNQGNFWINLIQLNILSEINSILSYPRGVEWTFSPCAAHFLGGVIFKSFPLLIAVSASIYQEGF